MAETSKKSATAKNATGATKKTKERAKAVKQDESTSANCLELVQQIREGLAERKPIVVASDGAATAKKSDFFPAVKRKLKKVKRPSVNVQKRRCKAWIDDSSSQCNNNALEGSPYCLYHEKIYSEESNKFLHIYHRYYNDLHYGNTLDVLSAYLKELDEEEQKFVLSVYGDTSLDTEIALLRLMIRELLNDESRFNKYQHLPRLVSSLSDAFREATRMLEGNRLIIEFSDRSGEEYWRELFRTFKRFVEEGLVSQLCSDCKAAIAKFIGGGLSGEIAEKHDLVVSDV